MKTALVTGGTGGIGLHIAGALADRGWHVLVTGRDPARGEQALSALRARRAARVELLLADGALVRENVRLAEEVAGRVDRLDVLVNNVGGGMSPARRETAEGVEDNLARNFAGPLALTLCLLPLLERSRPARIVNVVSSAYRMWKGDPLADLEAGERYVPLEVHGRAKLLNILAVLALSRRVAGAGVTINAVNPGMAWTPATEALTPAAVPQWRFIWPVVRWIQRRASAEAAARGPVFLATAPEATFSGRYFDGLRDKALLPALLSEALQDRALALGQSLVTSH